MSQDPAPGLSLTTDHDVYYPAEDSWLVARNLEVRPGERCLDVGTGSGYLALVMARSGGHVVATDVSPLACRLARGNASANDLVVDVVQTDLVAGLTGPFDLVVCNPPYLPTGEHEHVSGPLDRAFSGGPDGTVVTRRFLDALGPLLAPAPAGGRAYLAGSSLQPLEDLEAHAAKRGLTWEVVGTEPYGMEILHCIRLTLREERSVGR